MVSLEIMALLDQVAALKWINNNIEQFGGDPDNITIFGQSAGAGSVQSLCASPLAKDLISQAISMSGGGLSGSRPGVLLDTAQLANKKMMDYFGKTTLEEMRALSFEELRQMSADYTTATGGRVMWSPVIDNYLSSGLSQIWHVPPDCRRTLHNLDLLQTI
jgi:para-nitrobenzyl esterase